MKKILLMLCLFVSFLVPNSKLIVASEENKVAQFISNLNFEEKMRMFFSNPKEYKIYSRDNKDITEYFYNFFVDDFNQKNFTAIENFFKENVYAFHFPTVIKDSEISTYSFSVKTYEHYYQVYPVVVNDLGKEFEYRVTMCVEGQFNYNDNTYEIVSYTKPRMSIYEDTSGASTTIKAMDCSTDVRINNDLGCLEIVASCYFNVKMDWTESGVQFSFDEDSDYYDSGLFEIYL